MRREYKVIWEKAFSHKWDFEYHKCPDGTLLAKGNKKDIRRADVPDLFIKCDSKLKKILKDRPNQDNLWLDPDDYRTGILLFRESFDDPMIPCYQYPGQDEPLDNFHPLIPYLQQCCRDLGIDDVIEVIYRADGRDSDVLLSQTYGEAKDPPVPSPTASDPESKSGPEPPRKTRTRASRGYSYHKPSDLWRAYRKNPDTGRRESLGYYKTESEARLAYVLTLTSEARESYNQTFCATAGNIS